MSNEKKIDISYEWPFGWLSFWLFTIGIADLSYWQGLLALILWPYYLGDACLTLSQ